MVEDTEASLLAIKLSPQVTLKGEEGSEGVRGETAGRKGQRSGEERDRGG